jgi:hypothetical protein
MESENKHIESAKRRIDEYTIPEPNSGCLLWLLAHVKHKGAFTYGRMKFRRRTQMAHRVSYIVNFGEIPKGLFVLHRCDNPLCVNPLHLFLGTKRDNIIDAIKKGRAPSRSYKGHRLNRGELSGKAKLKNKQIPVIMRMYACGIRQTTIAKLYRVSSTTISSAISGRYYSLK